MKKELLLLALIPNLYIQAQDNYHPFLSEGKSWTYRYSNSFQGVSYTKTYIIGGDTIINNLEYSMICDSTTSAYEFAMREEDRKVYVVYSNKESEQLVYDFGKNVDETVRETTDPYSTITLFVTSVDTVYLGSRAFRRLRVCEYEYENGTPKEEWDLSDGEFGTWIEGVGALCGLAEPVRYPGNNWTFVRCRIGDEYYGQEIFTTDVRTITTSREENINNSTYDLQGRQLKEEPTHGIYIKDGKKIAR